MTKILIADDSPFMCRVISDILKDGAYQIVGEARNGVQAVEQCLKHRPDVVLMDILMPEMDGIQATQAIKKDCPAAKVIICTVMHDDASLLSAIRAGASDFVCKPFYGEMLKHAIESVMWKGGN